MNRDHKRVQQLAALVLVAAGGVWLFAAGPLNPPSGPVSAGGKTTQEIYDAVTGISGSIGGVGGRGPAVPGPSTAAGNISVSGPNSFSSAIIGMRFGIATPTSGGQSTGPSAMQNNGITVVRAISGGTVASFRSETANQNATSVTITIPSSVGSTTYQLTNAKFTGFRNYLVQRSDGTYGAIEEIDLLPQTIQITDPSGSSHQWQPFGGGV